MPTLMSCGCEHELADIPLSTQLPEGYGRDVKDYTIVNSNGIANDPSGRYYGFGGEINTPPTDTSDGQVEVLEEIIRLHPLASVNYRSNLHVHVRLPGLREDLAALKRVQSFIHNVMPMLFSHIVPLIKPDPFEFEPGEELAGAMRRYRRRMVSHRTLLTPKRLERQMRARTVEEFFEREVPQNHAGKPMWHMQPRTCVSLRQLLQTDTVEFRHFPGTLDGVELKTCVDWCTAFMVHAVSGYASAGALLHSQSKVGRFPRFPKYSHWREVRYRATCHDGSVPKEQIAENIHLIETGNFGDSRTSSGELVREV